MMRVLKGAVALWLLGAATPGLAQTLQENNERMFRQMQDERGLSGATMQRVRGIFAGSSYIGQGNPAVTRHPMTPQEARKRLPAPPERLYRNAKFERICAGKYMAPLYDPQTERPEDAEVCVDMFEYHNIPMVYPLTWVKASSAGRPVVNCWVPASVEMLPRPTANTPVSTRKARTTLPGLSTILSSVQSMSRW